MAILDELLVRLGIDAEELTGGASRAAGEVEGSLKGIAAAGAGVAVGGLFVAGLTSAMDATAANTKLTNQLGLTADEAKRAGDVAGDVFSQGFGASIDEVNESLGAVASNMGGMSKVSNAELKSMTAGALALADTFDFDVAESTKAVGTLLKTGLAKNGTEAMDLLTAAAQKLPPAFREELPSLVGEYGEFFDQLGFTGPEMMGLLAEAAKNPVFEIDKLGDAVKEFTLKLADTDAVKEPLNALGLDVARIQSLVNQGKGTQAFDEVTTALKGVEDQTARTKLQAALFGGPGEDLGNSLLNISAKTAPAKNGLNDVAGATKAVTDNMAASPAQQFESITRSLSTVLGETLAPALSAISGFLAEHPGLMSAVTPVVLALAAALAIWAAVQFVLNSALLMSPITWIILAVVALIAIIVLIATRTTWFQDLWSTVWGAVKDAAAAVWNWIVSTAAATWAAIRNGASSAWNGIVAFLRGAFEFIVGLFLNFTGPGLIIKHWDTIKEKTAAAWNWVVDKVSGAVDGVLGFIQGLGALPGIVGGYFLRMGLAAGMKINELIALAKGLPGRIFKAVGDLNMLLFNAGRDIIRGLINGVSGMINSLRDKFRSVTNMIPDWKGPITVDQHLLEPSGQALMGGLMDGVDVGTARLHKQLTGITSTIPANVDSGVSQAANGTSSGNTLVLRVEGGDEEWVQLVRRIVRADGGDVQSTFGTSDD